MPSSRPRRSTSLPPVLSQLTPALVGVLFCLLLGAGCKESSSQGPPQPIRGQSAGPPTASLQPPQAVTDRPLKDYQGTRIVFYNLRNYLRMDRRLDGRLQPQAPKPEAAIAALTRIICAAQPDVLGVCEIGGPAELADLQQRLETEGLRLPHSEWVEGADPERHVAILSRYPIIASDPVRDWTYPIRDTRLPISRGLLDVTLEIHGQPLEILIAHLKSKREIPNFNQAEMRRQEAALVRRRMNQRLQSNPDARFVLMGDFNDSRRSPSLEVLQGPYGQAGFCECLPLEASDGTRWTHHWAYQDLYSRFDYIFVSPALRPLVNIAESKILDDPQWDSASDHRALLLSFH